MTERSSVVLVAGVSFGTDAEARHALAKNSFNVLGSRRSDWHSIAAMSDPFARLADPELDANIIVTTTTRN